MIEELTELLHRQVGAMETVEGRLRVVELLVAAGEQRFVTPALDDLDRAAERLAALELGRTMVLAGAGLPAETAATELVGVVRTSGDDESADRLASVVDRLRGAAARVAELRERVRTVATAGAQGVAARLESTDAVAPQS